MNYKQRAVNWYQRGKREKDPFVKFVIYYISLEVLSKLAGGSIRDLKNEPKLFSNIDRKLLNDLVKKLKSKPLINMDPNGDHRWDGIIRNEDDVNGIVEFIIRARNNLFHGDKDLNSKRDLFIAKYGNAILEPLIEAGLAQLTMYKSSHNRQERIEKLKKTSKNENEL